MRRGGEGRNSLARFRLRGPRSFAPAPGPPVSQASGVLLVLLEQDYQANTPPHVRMHLQYKRARQRARFGMARGVLENRDFEKEVTYIGQNSIC